MVGLGVLRECLSAQQVTRRGANKAVLEAKDINLLAIQHGMA
jgi:hypothetical protein